ERISPLSRSSCGAAGAGITPSGDWAGAVINRAGFFMSGLFRLQSRAARTCYRHLSIHSTPMLIWIILIIVPMLFGLYAQMRIRSAYTANAQVGSRGGITGRE